MSHRNAWKAYRRWLDERVKGNPQHLVLGDVVDGHLAFGWVSGCDDGHGWLAAVYALPDDFVEDTPRKAVRRDGAFLFRRRSHAKRWLEVELARYVQLVRSCKGGES